RAAPPRTHQSFPTRRSSDVCSSDYMANPASAPGTTKKPAPKPAPAGKGQPKKGDAAAPPVGKTRPKGTGEVAPRLRDRFRATIVPALMKERSYANPFAV